MKKMTERGGRERSADKQNRKRNNKINK